MKYFSIKWEKDIKFEGFLETVGIPPTLYLFPILWKIFHLLSIKFLRLLQYHQIDIKFSCLQEKPMSTLFYR